MPPLSLNLNGATVIIRLANKTFTLTAPSTELSLPDSTQANSGLGAHVKFAYHSPYETAVDLGTPQYLLQSVEQLLGDAAPQSANHLWEQWSDFQAKIQQVPVLNQVADTALNTNVRITDIVIDLNFRKDPGGTGKFDGTFTLGLMFTPDPNYPVKLLMAELVAFGATLSVRLAGDSTSNILGFTWP